MSAARPIVIAHRGASGYLPEHTLAGYFLAAELGADYLEPDLVMTRDAVLVARHENEISTTTDVASRPEFAARKATRTIDGVAVTGWFTEDFDLAELKTLRARERLPDLRPGNARFDGHFSVPTFEEVLELATSIDRLRAAAAVASGRAEPAPIGVYPETKHPSYFAALGLPMEAAILDALARHGFRPGGRPAFIQSFEVGNLRALRRLTPLPLVQLIEADGAPFDVKHRGEATTYADLLTAPGLASIASYADAIGVPKSAVLRWPEPAARLEPPAAAQSVAPAAHSAPVPLDSGLVRSAHSAGLEVHVWTFRAENAFLPPALRCGPNPADHGDLVAEIRAALEAGIDGFFVDQTDLGVRARAGRRSP
jgi:glycerophosphoryl diester phosphodiesterase